MTGGTSRSIGSASAVMALGTTFSRLSGSLRAALLAAALGSFLHADLFNVANTIPNMLYILLAGGVFNAVLVPQLVRTMKHDADGGLAYANRVITFAAMFLGVVTIGLIVAAPWVMRIFLNAELYEPEMAAQRASAVNFARLCLPQVFFYGMFVLVGQILNARGRFGPMMWAPIANNAIAITVLVIYLMLHGSATGAELCGGFSTDQELLLGLGATAGIVAQFAILVPYLRAAGFVFRPRFDFRHVGLGHTFTLGLWTVLFVVVNQVAYTVVVNLASGGTAGGCGATSGTGYTIYAYTFLLAMVPHSIVTVSLATAVLPTLSRLAADDSRADLARTLAEVLRTALVIIVPFACLLVVIGPRVADVAWGYGAAADQVDLYVPSLTLFGIGLVFFTVHYLVLRGFYAMELNRTVFLIQCAVAATNIVAATVLVGHVEPEYTAPALVVAYATSYAVGAVVSYTVLRRRLGGLETAGLIRFLGKVGIAALAATIVGYLARRALEFWLPAAAQHRLLDQLTSVAVVALVMAAAAATFIGVARLLRITEVGNLLAATIRRKSNVRSEPAERHGGEGST
ncbi:MAG: murein biosynthesis integral membrane protein MurJ [Nocardioides sp.]